MDIVKTGVKLSVWGFGFILVLIIAVSVMGTVLWMRPLVPPQPPSIISLDQMISDIVTTQAKELNVPLDSPVVLAQAMPQIVAKIHKGKMERERVILMDASVTELSRSELVDLRANLVKLKKVEDELRLKSETATSRVNRFKEEKEKTIDAFKDLQESAVNAGVPNVANATAEDRAKTIQIGPNSISYEAVYRLLEEYKAEVKKVDAAIAAGQKESDFCGEHIESIRSQMSLVENDIAERERTIKDHELLQKLLEVGSLNLADDVLEALRQKTEEVAARLKMNQEAVDVRILDEQMRTKPFSITGNDLIDRR